MIDRLQLPRYTEEEALSRILSYLRQVQRNPSRSVQTDVKLHIPDVVRASLPELQEEWRNQHPNEMVPISLDTRTNSEPFFDAAWSLCTRGILRPAISYPQPPYPSTPVTGADFRLTPYGEEWLSELSGYETVPAEYGRFSELLASHAHRFKTGFHVRSQEAIKCYRAHTYLACCVMCGAAAESILLSLAIAKTGSEDEVLREYMTNTGRTRIENKLLSHANKYVRQELPNYTNLLKYWRDAAAHGADTGISETEAFTSLLLLLRFAQFADERWAEITNQPESQQAS